MMGLGFSAVLLLLGAMRELIGTGALFANMDLLFGPNAANLKIVIFSPDKGFLVAVLPPGAFLFAGLLIALKNLIDRRVNERAERLRDTPVAGSKRVRVTGHIS